MNVLLRSIPFLAALLPMAASAQWWESSFDVDVGYRADSLACIIDAYNPPGDFEFTDDLQIKGLQVLEGGTKGKCIAWETFLLKGSLLAGGIQSGNYTNEITLADGSETRTKLKVQGGQTLDVSLGGGFLFPIGCYVRLGPTGGWSYNHQHVKMQGCAKPFRCLKYKNRWQGAWVGGDAYISLCGFSVNAGYEYHVPHWSGYWLIKGKQPVDGYFSDVRKATCGWGNVAYFEVATTSVYCIRLNCQLKYQYWKMRDGCVHPKSRSFKSVGLEGQEEKMRQATWQSFEILLGVGMEF